VVGSRGEMEEGCHVHGIGQHTGAVDDACWGIVVSGAVYDPRGAAK
jgi:hypothetical protein